MARISKVENLMNLAAGLTAEQKEELVNGIMDMLNANLYADKSFTDYSKSSSCNLMVIDNVGRRPDCPHCGAKAKDGFIIKKGFKKDVQRFKCKHCGKLFVPTTNTVFEGTRKSADTWKKFIELTISGATLETCVYKCDICMQTAFVWRHKLLEVFITNQSKTLLSGDIQIDEKLVPISFKGNHAKGHFHKSGDIYSIEERNMPRKAYKRGSDNRPKSSTERACVFCMVQNGGKNYFAAVAGTGYMNDAMLDENFAPHIIKGKSTILTDKQKATCKYLKENDYKYEEFLSNTSDDYTKHKPEIKEDLHLQHVNGMHSHMDTYLKPYRGISTKHLNGYVSMFVWMKQAVAKHQKRKVYTITELKASTAGCYIKSKEISAKPAVPNAA